MDVPKRNHFNTLVFTCVLLIPLSACLYFNQLHSASWFFRAAVACILAAQILLMSTRIPVLWLRYVVTLSLTASVGLFIFGRLASFYIQGESLNERFYYHANLNTLITAGNAYPALLKVAALMTLIFLTLASVILHKYPYHYSLPRTLSIILVCTVSIPMIDPDISHYLQQQLASRQAQLSTLNSIDWEQTGLHPEALERNLGSTEAGKNLLFIYLEGLEQIFTEPDIFPELTPFLTGLKEKQGLFFPNMVQTSGTEWTMAGMLASQCGTPLLTTIGASGNDVMQSGYINKATCLGDILHDAGYYQVFIGGADTAFAGKGRFLELHQYDEVLGKQELVQQLDKPGYLNNWGLYDESLFALAEQRFTELADIAAEAGQPFNLTMLTVDTHLPGYSSAACPGYARLSHPMLDAISCTDHLLKQFFSRLQDHPAWDDTLIVLFSDHLLMNGDLSSIHPVPEDYQRKLLLNFLNAGSTGVMEIQAGSHSDVAGTVLDLMEVKRQQKFLAGQSMVAETFVNRANDFSKPERLEAIRYINANVFTQHESRICSDTLNMLKVENDALYLNNREIYLGLNGAIISPQQLREDYSFVVLFEENGTVKSSVTVQNENLPFFLHQASDYYHLVITSSQIAGKLDDALDSAKQLSVLLGHPESGKLISLGNFASAEELNVAGNCRTQLSRLSSNNPQQHEFSFAKYCLISNPEVSATIDADSGDMSIDLVAFGNSWYSAKLEAGVEGGYRLVSRQQLEPQNISQIMENSFCHAYMAESKVLIPYARTRRGLESLILEEIPGGNFEFRMADRKLL